MGIQGRVKIEIRDAVTGELKHKREEHNMLTGAAANVINAGLARARRGNYSSVQLGNSSEDIIRMLFGGVMVFSRSIDTSHLVPDYIESLYMIGNANQGSPIAGSSFKGNLRSATVTDDSAKFIWDFSATQCNGQIASICLTSNKGGELGCKFDARDSARNGSSLIYGYSTELLSSIANSFSSSYPRTDIFEFQGSSSNDGLRILDGNSLVYYYNTTKYTWDISKYKNRFDFNENQTAKITIPRTTESVTTPIIGQSSGTGNKLVRGPITNYAFMGKCTYEQNGADYTYTLDLVKCTKNSQSTVHVPMNNIITAIKAKYAQKGCSTPSAGQNTAYNITDALAKCCFTWNNKLIWLMGSYNNSDTDFLCIYIQNLDGSYVVIDQIQEDTAFYDLIHKSEMTTFKGVLYGTGSTVSNAYFDLAVIDEQMYIRSKTSDNDNEYYFLLTDDDDETFGAYFSNRPNFYTKNANVCFSNLMHDELAEYPFYRACNNAKGGGENANNRWCVNSLLRTAYLATVQNQADPAVKTPSDVMTITYTLMRSN